jgi:hypothetical protein
MGTKMPQHKIILSYMSCTHHQQNGKQQHEISSDSFLRKAMLGYYVKCSTVYKWHFFSPGRVFSYTWQCLYGSEAIKKTKVVIHKSLKDVPIRWIYNPEVM